MKLSDTSLGDLLLTHSHLSAEAAFAYSLIFFIPGATQRIKPGIFWFPIESTARIAFFHPASPDERVVLARRGLSELAAAGIIELCEASQHVIVPDLIRLHRPGSPAELYGRLKKLDELAISPGMKTIYLSYVSAECKRWGAAFTDTLMDYQAGLPYVQRKKDGSTVRVAGKKARPSSVKQNDPVRVVELADIHFSSDLAVETDHMRCQESSNGIRAINTCGDGMTMDLFSGEFTHPNTIDDTPEFTPLVEPTAAPQAQRSASPEEPKPSSKKRYQYSLEFEEAFRLYPKRAGDNPKKKAWHAWSARLKEGHTAQVIIEGVKRYAAYCDAGGITGTEKVKHAATFFGPDESFLEEWKPSGRHHRNRFINQALEREEYRAWEVQRFNDEMMARVNTTNKETQGVTNGKAVMPSRTQEGASKINRPAWLNRGNLAESGQMSAQRWYEKRVRGLHREQQSVDDSLRQFNELLAAKGFAKSS